MIRIQNPPERGLDALLRGERTIERYTTFSKKGGGW